MNPEKTHNDWDVGTYDGSHSFVYEHGEAVVELLEPQTDERILDLGCGTGHLTHRIAESGADVVGIDSAKGMIEAAHTNYPDCRFICADARSHTFEEPFDAVFSNAALHWINEQSRVVETVAGALKPGGRFVAELGGTGNVESIVSAAHTELEQRGYEPVHPWYFPTVGEYASLLETHGFEVRYARLFDRPTELDGKIATWLEMFGDELLAPLTGNEREAVITAVEKQLRDEHFENGVWTADYRRLRFLAINQSS